MEAHWKPYVFNRKNSHYVFVCLGQLFTDPSMGFITLKNHRLVWGICVCFFPQWTHLIHPKTIKRYKHIPWIPFKCLCFCWWRQVFSQCFFFPTGAFLILPERKNPRESMRMSYLFRWCLLDPYFYHAMKSYAIQQKHTGRRPGSPRKRNPRGQKLHRFVQYSTGIPYWVFSTLRIHLYPNQKSCILSRVIPGTPKNGTPLW